MGDLDTSSQNTSIDDGDLDALVRELAKKTFITSVAGQKSQRPVDEEEEFEAMSMLDIQEELRKAEELQQQIQAFAREQDGRRAELESYVQDLFAQKDPEDGDDLITLPADYDDMVAAMDNEVLNEEGEAGYTKGGVGLLIADQEAAADGQQTQEEQDPEKIKRNLQMKIALKEIKSGDIYLAKLQKQLRQLAAERAAENGSVPADEDTSQQDEENTTDDGTSATETSRKTQRSMYGFTDRAGGFIRRNIELLGDARSYYTDEDREVAERVMKQTDEEDLMMDRAYMPDDSALDRLRNIESRLSALTKDLAGIDAMSSFSFSVPDSASDVSVSESTRGRLEEQEDYLRAERENRIQRQKMREIERRIRYIHTTSEDPAQPEMIKQLLLAALAEDPPGTPIVGLELITAEDVETQRSLAPSARSTTSVLRSVSSLSSLACPLPHDNVSVVSSSMDGMSSVRDTNEGDLDIVSVTSGSPRSRALNESVVSSVSDASSVASTKTSSTARTRGSGVRGRTPTRTTSARDTASRGSTGSRASAPGTARSATDSTRATPPVVRRSSNKRAAPDAAASPGRPSTTPVRPLTTRNTPVAAAARVPPEPPRPRSQPSSARR